MSVRRGPPEFPRIRLELLEDISPEAPSGFFRLVRRRLRAHYPDGTESAAFVYDEIDRRSIDAVVIVAHYVAGGERRVFLRSSLRPPIYFRAASRTQMAVPENHGGLWELPAGLIEAGEHGAEDPAVAAARELEEEVGFAVPKDAMRVLGPSTYPAPGVLAERHFYYEVTVDPGTRSEPMLDGSALEKDGVVFDVPVVEALAMCARGDIEDGKTELALRRLVERYP
jgi:ADP-ribose pyrophosphatase